uniref:P2X purinoreceptor 7 intracellular domain-containing protein n=1 Tax=Amblyomma maculatum TaxID=34609 RepID=G3MT00_AMBMU
MDPELEQRLLKRSAELAKLGIEPYKYTPFKDPALNTWLNTHDYESDSTSSAGSDFSDDCENSDLEWCSCGFCETVATPSEQQCCRDVPELVEEKTKGCVTRHCVFEAMCCTPEVLRVVHWELRENGVNVEGDVEVEHDRNRAYRFIAHRMFTRWIWKTVGSGKSLPSCVVARIQREFPLENNAAAQHPAPEVQAAAR